MHRSLLNAQVTSIAFSLMLLATAHSAFAAGKLAQLASISPTSSCASLASADVTKNVGAAVHVTEATERPVDGVEYCAVKGTIAPHIGFELRLPVDGWTQRFVQVGCGGLCGILAIRLEHAEDCQPARDHALALASTDMGHRNKDGMLGDGSFGRDPQARIDFAYRAVHLTALASKALIAKYYGKSARYSYFSGCSDGGREALIEAQRYPEDFDGIAAGAPAMNFQVQNTFYHAWMYASNHRSDGTAIIIAAKLRTLHKAALKSCDALDGQKDGIITDPRLCHFDPVEAQCKADQAADDRCLTAEEVEAARKLYNGPRDGAGHRFTIGGPQVGSELSWQGVYVPRSAAEPVMSEDAALGTLQYVAFEENPPNGYKLGSFRFDESNFERLKPLHALYDATDTDLKRFEARQGKLILWHGWSDPHISPINTIAYYRAVRDYVGSEKTDQFVRLFLFPGMYHCGGGDGFSAFDVLTPLMEWAEAGVAPDQIIASHAGEESHFMGPSGPGPHGPPDFSGQRVGDAATLTHMPSAPDKPASSSGSRPVYAYPSVAHYTASGLPDSAASFAAGAPLVQDPASYSWEGAGFFAPDFQRDCSVKEGKLSCS